MKRVTSSDSVTPLYRQYHEVGYAVMPCHERPISRQPTGLHYRHYADATGLHFRHHHFHHTPITDVIYARRFTTPTRDATAYAASHVILPSFRQYAYAYATRGYARFFAIIFECMPV